MNKNTEAKAQAIQEVLDLLNPPEAARGALRAKLSDMSLPELKKELKHHQDIKESDARIEAALDTLQAHNRGLNALADLKKLLTGPAAGLDSQGYGALITLIKEFYVGCRRDFLREISSVVLPPPAPKPAPAPEEDLTQTLADSLEWTKIAGKAHLYRTARYKGQYVALLKVVSPGMFSIETQAHAKLVVPFSELSQFGL